MIDTIGVQFNIPIDLTELTSWGTFIGQHDGGFNYYRWLNVTLGNGAVVKLVYLPYVLSGNPLSKLEFSLPNVVFGSNAHMVYNIEQTINLANVLLPDIPGVPPIKLWDGVLYRLDTCYNHQFGDLVPYFIKPLQALEYSRRRTLPYTSQGVQYINDEVVLKFYDKERERRDKKDITGALISHGVLRQEAELYKRWLCRRTKKKKPTLRDINLELLLDVQENGLRQLNLLNRSIATRKDSAGTALRHVRTWAGIYYYGLLVSKYEQPSKKTISSVTGLHPKSLDRQLDKIVKANLPLTLTETEEPLPPFVIDRDMVRKKAEECMCLECRGDTSK